MTHLFIEHGRLELPGLLLMTIDFERMVLFTTKSRRKNKKLRVLRAVVMNELLNRFG